MQPEALPDTAPERIQATFAFADCRPDPRELCRALGYPEGMAPEVALDAIEGLFARGEELWSLQGGLALYPDVEIDRAGARVVVAGTPFEVGKIVCGQLARATHLAVFVCTAGPRIQELYEGLMRDGDPFTSLLGSWMGSMTVERAMDRLQGLLKDRVAERGLRITNRYSPGYCGWGLAEQQKLFRLLTPGLAPVTLSESSLMQPIKSVSGFVGVGERVRFNDYTCDLCDMSACIYRDIRHSRAAASEEAHPHG